MARAHPSPSSKHGPITTTIMASSSTNPALLHAAWITAVVGVCLALCTIHSRSRPSSPSSSPSRRRPASSSASSNHRRGPSESIINGADAGTAATATATTTTPAATKVSPTPSDAAAKSTSGGGGAVTVIEVGTHGPIPPAFLPPPPDPLPPRGSLSSSSSSKHGRFAERVGRIRSMRHGGGGSGSGSGDAAAASASAADGDDDVFVVGCGGHRGGEVGEEGTLWTKTIILGERCRVPSGSDDDDEDGGGGHGGVTAVRKWKSYRPRQPRSVPVTRSNSFAGVGSAAGARRPTNPPRF